jgi:integration host factor subunit beta
MIKSELIEKLCSCFPSIDEATVADATKDLIRCMSATLCAGHRIEIRGFGSFSLHYRAERQAHNPKTGKRLMTKAKYSPHFKPGKTLKARVDSL